MIEVHHWRAFGVASSPTPSPLRRSARRTIGRHFPNAAGASPRCRASRNNASFCPTSVDASVKLWSIDEAMGGCLAGVLGDSPRWAHAAPLSHPSPGALAAAPRRPRAAVAHRRCGDDARTRTHQSRSRGRWQLTRRRDLRARSSGSRRFSRTSRRALHAPAGDASPEDPRASRDLTSSRPEARRGA